MRDPGKLRTFRSVMGDPASRIVAHYERHATTWDADRQNSCWNDKIWHDRFIARLGKGAKVLDLGCGSGRPVAQHMAEQGLRVTGVDTSPTMISLCRSRLLDAEWILADMRQLALGRRFDGILAWDSFFHLTHEDQRRMFPIFAEHASAGTVLMFNTGAQHGASVGEYKGDPLFHASLSPNEYRALIARFGFAVVEHATNDAAAGGRTVWLCRRGASGYVAICPCSEMAELLAPLRAAERRRQVSRRRTDQRTQERRAKPSYFGFAR